MSPFLKHLLRRRNSLLRRNKIEAANSLAKRIGEIIVKTALLLVEKSEERNVYGMKSDESQDKVVYAILCSASNVEGINSSTLNDHYQAVSSDDNFVEPPVKSSVSPKSLHLFTEYEVFRSLTRVHGTSEGPDGIPTWLLSSMAHLLAYPISILFQGSLVQSYVPPQWLVSRITPVPKIPHPQGVSDFRPISITSVLSRILEKHVVRAYFYPILTNPNINQPFSDQFAFRPSGSTTAALIALLHQILDILKTEPFVRLISLDFTRAFDSVSHSFLASVLSRLPIPDNIYNWVMALLKHRQHSTRYQGITSVLKYITASIIQGSGMGPMNFLTVISTLKAKHHQNRLMKYADDSYLLIPASSIATTESELENIALWASSCNLKLNASKSKEVIFRLPRSMISTQPPEYPGIQRVDMINILGIRLNDRLGFGPHIEYITSRAKQSMYAIRFLTAHGLRGDKLHEVVRATTLARLLYASPAWSGFVNAEQKSRINSIIKKLVRCRFLPSSQLTFEDLSNEADKRLFAVILRNPSHVLYNFLPPVKNNSYNLRVRAHNRILPECYTLEKRGFILRMIYNLVY